MLADAQVGVLLTQEGLVERLPEAGVEVVVLDREGEKIGAGPEENPRSGLEAENLAYVIYTSGTTGQHKGVAVQHRGVCNLVEYAKSLFGADAESRLLQITSLSFDISVLEIFMTLGSGGWFCLLPAGVVMSGTSLGQLLEENQISVIAQPPSVLELLPAEEFPALRAVGVGGEACPAQTPARWGLGRRLINAYGPTEATVFCCEKHEWEEYRPEAGAPPVGRPIANIRAHVLDASLNLAPVGVEGKLYLAAVHLARGYL